jgi:hypothetical protein
MDDAKPEDVLSQEILRKLRLVGHTAIAIGVIGPKTQDKR